VFASIGLPKLRPQRCLTLEALFSTVSVGGELRDDERERTSKFFGSMRVIQSVFMSTRTLPRYLLRRATSVCKTIGRLGKGDSKGLAETHPSQVSEKSVRV
jgi:hypothetical protein